MPTLAEEIAIYREVVSFFDGDPKEILERAATALQKIFRESLSTEKKLRESNSVYESLRFEVRARVKSPTNLKEKLIRSSEGLNLIRKLRLESAGELQDKAKQKDLLAWVLGFKDIVGIRLVCDLDVDCVNAYNAILSKKAQYGAIQFIDLEGQPQDMKNGRPIYRIKGTYEFEDREIGFELQIKSRLDEGWGELEHKMFYKSYQYTPVREVLKLGMVHAGTMLESVEHYMLRIRDEARQSPEAYRSVRFYTDLQRVYGAYLKKQFGHEFPLDVVQELLMFTYEKLRDSANEWWKNGIDLPAAPDLDFRPPAGDDVQSSLIREAWACNYHVRVAFAIVLDWNHRLTLNQNDSALIGAMFAGAADRLAAKGDLSAFAEDIPLALDDLISLRRPQEALDTLLEEGPFVVAGRMVPAGPARQDTFRTLVLLTAGCSEGAVEQFGRSLEEGTKRHVKGLLDKIGRLTKEAEVFKDVPPKRVERFLDSVRCAQLIFSGGHGQ